MSINRRTPDLSSVANNDFDDSFGDLDDIIEKESGYNGTPDPQQNNSYDNGFDDIWGDNDIVKPSVRTQDSNSFSNNQPQGEDKLMKEMENILDDALDGGEDKVHDYVGSDKPELNTLQQPTKSNQEEDPYFLALNLMQEFDLIRLPEDLDYSTIDANTLAEFKNQTLQYQHDEALDSIRSKIAADPQMLRLFDYAYNGGEFANIPLMTDIIQEETDFLEFNISHPDNQKYILNLYLTEGLDERNPRDRKLLESIPDQIEKIASRNELETEALNAKRYFVEKTRERAIQEENRILQNLQEQDRLRQLEEYEAQVWDQEFRNTLRSRPWNEEKKRAIAQEASFVTLDNGQQIPMWQYKQQVMLSDPGLFQEFLDFTSKFDVSSGRFLDASHQEMDYIPQHTLNKFVERLQKKGIRPNSTTGGKGQNFSKSNKKLPSVNVKREWFNG